MSEESMERIVGRAVTNREYRERLLARPEEALKGYHLTDEEMCRVKGWTDRTFEMLIDDLERQVDGLRFDASAGFRELTMTGLGMLGERISPAALRFLLPRCLPELYACVSAHESSRDDARSGARPIRPKPDRAISRCGQTGGTYAVTASSGSTTRKRSRPLWRIFEPPTSGLKRPESPRPRACSGTLRRRLHSHRSSPARHGWWNWGSSVKSARPQPTGKVCASHSCSVLYGGAYGPWRYVCPRVCGGSAFTWEESRARALGEAVERFCAAVYDERTFVLDCQRNLAPEAIDPSTVALFSATQYREPGFAFQPFTEETRVTWTWGYSLLQPGAGSRARGLRVSTILADRG